MEIISLIIFGIIVYILWTCCGGSSSKKTYSTASMSSREKTSCTQSNLYPDLSQLQNNSIFNLFGGGSYEAILDKFSTLEEVQTAIRKAGLESCNLIFGVDYTASNLQQGIQTFGGRSLHDTYSGTPNPYQRSLVSPSPKQNTFRSVGNNDSGSEIVHRWQSHSGLSDLLPFISLASSVLTEGNEGIDYTVSNMHSGQMSFGGKSLHAIGPMFMNPYQQVICILGETLEPFDDDGIIPAFGFGDVSTRGHGVFAFRTEGYCNGFHDVLEAYNQITPNVRMSGPTNFAPLIRQAIDIVKKTKSYHILVIVADGQVTNEQDTINAIVEASRWPLSIVMVGVGDGPWEVMKEFDDKIPHRKFDNFQFVDFNSVMVSSRNPQAAFALQALMEIPDQYKLIQKHGLLKF